GYLRVSPFVRAEPSITAVLYCIRKSSPFSSAFASHRRSPLPSEVTAALLCFGSHRRSPLPSEFTAATPVLSFRRSRNSNHHRSWRSWLDLLGVGTMSLCRGEILASENGGASKE
ncbi:hypothetical protein LINPERPRIM_LOCUS11079, partial [Linum perenne]